MKWPKPSLRSSLGPQGAREHSVELTDVHYSAGDKPVFAGLTLCVPRGRIASIMGTSGTGKTTLLRLITGQVRPDRGSVRVEGQEVPALSKAHLYALRLNMGVLFQQGALFTDLSVFENVAFPVREHTALPEAVLRTLVLMKLQAVGLRGAAALLPHEISGGMARRVALARAVVLDPALLLCDEPFTGLDPISTGVVIRLLRTMNEVLGITIIVVSHDIPETELLADTHFILANGQVAASGRPEDLRRNSSPLVRQFLAGEPDGPIPFHYPAPDYFEDLMNVPLE